MQKTQTNFVNKFLENIEKYIYKIVKDILSKISIDGGGGGSLISNPSDTDGLPEGGAVGQILTIISLEPRVLAWSDAPALMQTPNWWSLFTQSKIDDAFIGFDIVGGLYKAERKVLYLGINYFRILNQDNQTDYDAWHTGTTANDVGVVVPTATRTF